MQPTARTTRLGARARRSKPTQRGFTIIELLVAIVVIAILIGVLIVAISAALRAARRAGEQQTATGIQTGIGVFQNTFNNSLPPLVYDGAPIDLLAHASTPKLPGAPANGEGPVVRPGGATPPTVSTLENIYLDGGAVFLTGRVPPDGTGTYQPLFNPERDPRYSKFSLPIFLTGALGEDADGVSGPGLRLTYTNRGGWSLGGQSQIREPLYEASRASAVVSSYVSVDEYREHGKAAGGVLPPGATDANPDRTAFVNGAGVAVRYYRWAPTDPNADSGGPSLQFLNLPLVLRDPRTWANPDEPGESISAELRSAAYAVVSAGPNGLFGTEPVALLRERLGIGSGVADEVVRFEAWQDNVVRVGK